MRKPRFTFLVFAAALASASSTAGAAKLIKDLPQCGETVGSPFKACRLAARWGTPPDQWGREPTGRTPVNAVEGTATYVRAPIPRGAALLGDKANYAVQFWTRGGGISGSTSHAHAFIAVRLWLTDASGQQTRELRHVTTVIPAGKWELQDFGGRNEKLGFEPAFVYVEIEPVPWSDWDGTVAPTDPTVGLKELEIAMYPR